ncbi:hypothetical protein SBRCBS47491_003808 [Sporothrix bragantina]|uniref:Major facilitator superfamily (MFS) profile domain-containing protein n=1 Tax=Sporothrix bragantina TaxID=671064 RepID=A0ABP0BID4_9PEZI
MSETDITELAPVSPAIVPAVSDTTPAGLLAPPVVPAVVDKNTVGALEVAIERHDRTGWRLYAILASLFLSLFIAALDQTIVATCIPTIAASLHSATGYVWIGGAYLLATAAAGPIWARSSDIWGRKPMLLAAIALFAVASTIAALSKTMSTMIAARALQGVAGGGVFPLVTITISDLFSVRLRSLYLGALAIVWAVAGSSGPLLGGALTQLASWRWCFWINLPICGISFGLVLAFLDVHNPRTPLREGLRAVDWLGTITILAVTLLVLLGLDFGGATFPWNSPKVISLIAVGVAMIGAFIYTEARLAAYPIMPLGMFNHWHNIAICIMSFAHNMVAIGCEFYLPLYFQSAKQASPFRSGLLLVPMTAAEAGVDILAGVIIHYTGRYREMMWVGTSFMCLGTGLFLLFTPDTSVGTIIGFEVIGGVGTALLFQSPMLAVQNTVRQSETATATATMGFIRNVATALSVVLGGVVLQNGMNSEQTALQAAGLNSTTLAAFAGNQAAANVDLVASIADASQRRAVQDAFSSSIRNIFLMYTVLAGTAVLASLFVRQRKLQTEHTETKTGIDQLERRKNK